MNLGSLLTAILLQAAPADPIGLELRIMSFNIRYGTADDGEDRWEKRKDLVFGVIRKREPDVVALQEALRFQIDEIRRSLPVYGKVGVGRDDGAAKGELAAILYRADRFEAGEQGTFWLSDTPEVVASKTWGNDTTRVCTWVRLVEKSTGKACYIYNVHLDHRSQPSRERAVELVAARMAARRHVDPSILAGDFNAGESNPAVRYLKGEIRRTSPEGTAALAPPGLVDTFRVLHPSTADVRTFHAFKGGATGEKIDFIFTPPWAQVLEAEIVREGEGERYPSDHYPVTARLALPVVRES